MKTRERALLLGGWLLLVAVALLSRPAFPIDETRYLAVAWEMWTRGDFLVPYLNGAPYSHKPPLLFWLMHLGWVIFGVNEWWPRLLPAFFALGGVWLTARLARQLWPAQPQVGEMSVWVLSGSLLWVVFMTLLMFDMLLAFFVLLAANALVRAAQGHVIGGFGLLAAALGLGLLSKGPVIFVHVLPVALLAPWWRQPLQRPLWRWYAALAVAAGLALLVALAWALPAAHAAGEQYAREILWGQSAGRVVASFAHHHPPWWYLPWLPLVLFPWLAWPALWDGWRRLPQVLADPGVRFLLAWMVPAFLVLSAISGKQLHYLLPLVPAFALFSARALCQSPGGGGGGRCTDLRGPAAALVAAGGAGLYLAFSPSAASLHAGVALPAWPFLFISILGVLLALCAVQRGDQAVRRLSAASLITVVVVHAGLIPRFVPYYDPATLAAYLAQRERAGQPIAHVGPYHGQYHFAGRLERPFTVIEEAALRDWLQRHPEGRVIVYRRMASLRGWAGEDPLPRGSDEEALLLQADYAQPFRGGIVLVLGHNAVSALVAAR